tara:strand:- start:111 stop:986 length:876 start_codon:yes stop_codon:yes gene_type:complete
MAESQTKTIEELIDSLDVEIPIKEKFLELSKIFVINPIKDINPNFERGILLYSLVTKYRPKNILEIGTAEGFSALCMAWAMTDCDINGKIFTIDPKPFDLPKKRINTWDENAQNEFVHLSTKELWTKFAKKEWLKKIQVLSGYSGEILHKLSKQLPNMDMGYIDGHHAYTAVRHDFHAFLKNSSENFILLFDDYHTPDVSKLINDEIKPAFDTTIISTNAHKQRKIPSNSENDIKMCFIQSTSLKQPFTQVFPKNKSEEIINEYVKWEKRWKIRNSINQKLPFLRKIKFSR